MTTSPLAVRRLKTPIEYLDEWSDALAAARAWTIGASIALFAAVLTALIGGGSQPELAITTGAGIIAALMTVGAWMQAVSCHEHGVEDTPSTSFASGTKLQTTSTTSSGSAPGTSS